MSVKLSKIKKIENYAEYRADFVGFAPVATTNETTVDVHFISTRAVPAIINEDNEDNESDNHNEDEHIVKEKSLQIGSTNELVHSCTVTMPLVQLKGLREAIDSLLLQLEQQKQK